MVLRLIESCVKDRPQCIALDKILSRPRYLSCGVPQGSVLGSSYSLCIWSLLKISSPHTPYFDAMVYADDIQLYIFIRNGNRAVALENLSLCLDDIMSWNLCSALKRLREYISLGVFYLMNRLLRLKSVISTFSQLELSKTLV